MQNYSGSLALVICHGAAGEKTLNIGVISGIDPLARRAKIAFGDLSVSNFPLSDILVLKDKSTLYQQLLTSCSTLQTRDFKTLLQVNMLQDRPGQEAQLKAMELLRDSPLAAERATVDLGSSLGLSIQAYKGAEGRGR